ncbi:F-box protein At3g07870-like [Solanum lycopersicum]|uniref:F-box domain-containing protein n=1 Tax=Solanum lycopersicum TaxID=4081 RepID=A0A3Q7J6U7_SOLLC|nr:F-box protein At3g07870-like [Solanum lycopersicum]
MAADSDSFYFPLELLREILLKLPAESLIRFTVVCKSWYSLITSFPFISAHFAQTSHSETLFVRRYDSSRNREHYLLFEDSKNRPFNLNFTSELYFPFSCPLGYFRIVGSCNGILCLSDDLFGELRSLILWNPSIKKFIILPMPSINPQSPHMFVFGFGADLRESDDYKLVRLVYRKTDDVVYKDPPEIEIYSINSGVWRRVIGVEIKHCVVEFMWSQVFVNGVVHWIAYDVVANGGELRSLVMTFSIADEVFGEIMLPDALVGVIATNLSVLLFEESLAVVKYEREIDVASCEVWVMNQYGVSESWSRLYSINLVAGMERVVGFRKNGEVLFSTRSSDLVSYDPNSGQNRGLRIQGSSRSFYVQNYMESLILLKGNNVVSRGLLE